MKKFVLSALIFGTVFSAVAQFGYTEPAKNVADSEYTFTKVAHLDATPVES